MKFRITGLALLFISYVLVGPSFQ